MGSGHITLQPRNRPDLRRAHTAPGGGGIMTKDIPAFIPLPSVGNAVFPQHSGDGSTQMSGPAARPETRRSNTQPGMGGRQTRGRASDFEPGGSSSGPSKWWTQVSEHCPLCDFPICMLPYPPFKLQMREGGAKDYMLVDGTYLLLHVLTTWNFDVRGHPLNVGDIKALDNHMKRCKLGPYRLGHALELLATGTAQSQKELEELRASARKKLENLKHIQKVRRGRMPGEPPCNSVAPKSQQVCQRGQAAPRQPAAPPGKLHQRR